MDRFCFIISITGLNTSNTGEDDVNYFMRASVISINHMVVLWDGLY
jgi:hypothetical protein